jgi:hypothetical protein
VTYSVSYVNQLTRLQSQLAPYVLERWKESHTEATIPHLILLAPMLQADQEQLFRKIVAGRTTWDAIKRQARPREARGRRKEAVVLKRADYARLAERAASAPGLTTSARSTVVAIFTALATGQTSIKLGGRTFRLA